MRCSKFFATVVNWPGSIVLADRRRLASSLRTAAAPTCSAARAITTACWYPTSPFASAASVWGSFSSWRATSTRSSAAPPESLHFQRSQAVSESAPSALYSPVLSKRRTPVANTASSGSMPVSLICDVESWKAPTIATAPGSQQQFLRAPLRTALVRDFVSDPAEPYVVALEFGCHPIRPFEHRRPIRLLFPTVDLEG